MKTIVYDLETQSLCDLRIAGGYLYSRHPSTRVILVSVRLGGDLFSWRPLTQPRPDWMDELNGARLVAHNGFHFDHLFLQQLGVTPGELADSMYSCFANGLRGGLEIAARTQYDMEKAKDSTGYKVMRVLNAGYQGQLMWPNAMQMKALQTYSERDVELAGRLYDDLQYPDEPELIAADYAINQRGFMLNRERAKRVLHQELEEVENANREVAEHTNGLKARSIKLREWLADEGVVVDDLRAKTVERLLYDSDLPEVVRTVLGFKMQAAANTASKLARMQQRADPADDVIRYTLMYYGAHTGRWAGRGVQPHNFPRAVPSKGTTIDTVVRQDTWSTEERKMMLRPCIQARPGTQFLIIDFSSIEARILAWLADEQDILDKYAADEDLYLDMAAKVGANRDVGKVLVLGAGYGLGGGRLGDYATAMGLDLTAMGLDSFKLIEQFRDARPKIAGIRTGGVIPSTDGRRVGMPRRGGLWKAYDQAFRQTLETHRVSQTGRCLFRPYGTSGVDIVLPSGRFLAYRRCGEHGSGWRPQLTYQRSQGVYSKIYGGKITENIDQAIGRDLLGALLVRAEDAGLNTVLHVHDELVLERPLDADLQKDVQLLLDAVPAWAAGLPIAVEAFTAPWYTKKPPADTNKFNAKILEGA